MAYPSGPGKVNPDGSISIPYQIPKAPAQVPPETVVLTVGDVQITAKQFDELTNMVQEQMRAFVKGPGRKQFADQLVHVLVLAEEGKRRGLDKDPEIQLQEKFQAESVLAGATAQKVNQETKVDDAALHKYYDEHKSEYEQAHAHHILVRFKGSPVPVKPGGKDLTDEEALAKAKDLEKQLAAGADFSKLAGAESDDTGSAAMGGDLQTFGHGRMVAAFDDAVFKMKPGQISEPVKSQFGYHIIRLDSIEAKSFEEAKPDIEKKLRPQLTNEALENLQKTSKVIYDPTFFGMEKK